MRLCLIGTSHRLAPVALRERLAFSASDLRTALEAVHEHRVDPVIAGGQLAILSTCNRTELYFAPIADEIATDAYTDADVWRALLDFLARSRGLSSAGVDPWLYRKSGVDAVRHLCEVASGLDSMVVGEAEILGQVAAARDAAAEADTLGHLLTATFRSALRAGRRARAETGICRQPASVSSEAVALIRHEAVPFAGKRILIVGAGRMARRAGDVLRNEGAENVSVVSRTWSHVEEFADRLGATAVPWCGLEKALGESDVVLCATSAPHPVLTVELVRHAIEGRLGDSALLLIDTALPRDIEPGVRDLPGARLFDLDDLQARLREHLETRRQEAPAVQAIVSEEIETFEAWWRGTALRPVLAGMRERAEVIRQAEFDRMLSHLPELPDEARRQVEHLSRALVNRLLHEPTTRLREESDPARRGAYAEAARHLFGLNPSVSIPDAADGLS
ncbi:MAG: glutamyl-tRNA reductase [Gemmatimonadota bacterium]